VARDAGVSRATVSLVLRRSNVVAKTTAEKVHESIRRLGYVYNRTAAALRSRKTHTIGLIETNLRNSFFSAMCGSVENEMDKTGRAVLWANSSEQVEKQSRAVSLMLEYNVDGLLICPAAGTRKEDLNILAAHKIPFVLFSRYIPGWNTDFVGAANREGAREAVRHLLRRGYRNIVFVGGSPASSPWKDRTRGFTDALTAGGMPPSPEAFFPAKVSVVSAAAAAPRVLARRPRPTAALCYSDTVALGLMLGLEREGVLPGRDFGIAGFDNLEETALWKPSLTTMACPPESLGVEAARLLLRRIENPDTPPVHLEFSCPLIARESSAGFAG
jgi:LacI family transcriptional regulator